MSDEIKNVIIKKGKQILEIITIVLLIAVILASLFMAAINGVTDVTSDLFKDILDNIKIEGNNLKIDEDYLDNAKKKLKSMGINSSSLGLDGHEDYLQRFLEAEIVTNYPYLGGDELQGTVYFERAMTDGTTKELKYLPYDDFYNELNSGNSGDLRDYFTVDTNDWTVHVTKIEGGIEKINYKNMVSKFSMPFEFPIILSQITQNPNYCMAVVKLVKKSKIVITIAESKTTVVTHKHQTYTYNAEFRKNDGTTQTIASNQQIDKKFDDQVEETYTTSIFLSRALTWVANYSASPRYDNSQEEEKEIITPLDDTSGSEVSEDGTYYYSETNKKNIQNGTRYYNRWIRGTGKVVEKIDRFTNLIIKNKSVLGGSGLIDIAKNCHDYVAQNGYTYGSYGGTHKYPVEGEPMAARRIDCSAYVSWVLNQAGYGDILITAKEFGNLGDQLGWERITNIGDVQAGDICVWNGGKHVNICVGENERGEKIYYDCGCTAYIQAIDPITMNGGSLDYAVRPNDQIAESLSTASTPDDLETQIKTFIDGLTDGKYSVSYEDIDNPQNSANINSERVPSDGWTKLFVMAVAYNEIANGNLVYDDVKPTIESMITADNNSTTEILLQKIGNGDWQKGVDIVNDWLRKNGYKSTKITNEMTGEEGKEGDNENYTSTQNVRKLLSNIEKRNLKYSDEMLNMLSLQLNTELIASQIPDGTVRNKTGQQKNSSGNIIQDAAIVSINNANYVIAISAEDIQSVEDAKTNIKKIVEMINNYLKKYGTLYSNSEDEESDDEIPTILNGKRVCYEMIDGRWICPLDNLVEGRELMFKLLARYEKTQSYEKFMRYVLYLLTGNDYGVTEFDINELFLNGSFQDANGGIVGNSAEEKVWWALINAGYSKESAAGLMGNIYAECGFNASLIEAGNGIGFGLCQWSYGRRTQLESYAASKGVDPSDVNTQIEFLLGELTPGGGANGFAQYQLGGGMHGYTADMWKNASTPEDAAIAFCWVFERPGIPRMEVRTEAARRYYEQFKDAQVPSSNGGSDQPGNDVQKRIVDLALNHASEYGLVSGRCLAWVDNIYAAAGASPDRKACATEAGNAHIVSTDKNNIPLGAAVYGRSYIGTMHGGHNAGHIGIYVGNGQIVSNVGYLLTQTVDQWSSTYGFNGWGWEGNVGN